MNLLRNLSAWAAIVALQLAPVLTLAQDFHPSGATTVGLTAIPADNLLGNLTASTAIPGASVIGSCSAAGSALQYNTSTHAFGCLTGLASGASLGANTFTDTQTVTQATANHGILASTGYSETGSDATSMINLAGTLNTSGAAVGLKMAMTCTSCTNAFLMQILGGASGVTNELSLTPAGLLTISNQMNIGLGFGVGYNTRNYLYFGTSGCPASFDFANTTSQTNNIYLNAVDTSGTMQVGLCNSATPVARIIEGEGATGTDHTGGNLTIQAAPGTGTGGSGSLIFRTANPGSTGSTANTEVTALTIDNLGHLISGGAAPTCGTGCSSITGNDSAFVATSGTAVTSIAVNFGKTWGAAPNCMTNGDAATGFTFISAVSTTVLTIGASAAFTADKIYVHCEQ